MNTSNKSVIIARGVYYRAAFMDLADSDQSPVAKIIRRVWNDWINSNSQFAYDYVCNLHNELFDDINRNSEKF